MSGRARLVAGITAQLHSPAKRGTPWKNQRSARRNSRVHDGPGGSSADSVSGRMRITQPPYGPYHT
eukprot:1401758-Prymnesium_polylepis.1